MWEIEQILDEDYLFMRVHKNNFDVRTQKPKPIAFDNHGSGMSTDWDKYSTPLDTKQRAKIPKNYGVISLNAGEVRQIEDQSVEHSPSIENRAHTDVKGQKIVKERAKLLQIYEWKISVI